MNNTNRGANRLVIVITGIIFLILGGAAIALALPTTIRDAWQDSAQTVTSTITGWLQHTPLGGPGTSWLWIIALAALALLTVLLIVFIARQGRGHTALLYTDTKTEHGQNIIESGLAEHALQDALTHRPELVTSHVSTYRVRSQSVLKVSVTCRRGVSPQDVVTLVSEQLRNLDQVLGIQPPALIQISGGFRARTARSTRLR